MFLSLMHLVVRGPPSPIWPHLQLSNESKLKELNFRFWHHQSPHLLSSKLFDLESRLGKENKKGGK
jgi:hypothetical protein